MAAMHEADPAMARRHHCSLAVNDPPRQGGVSTGDLTSSIVVALLSSWSRHTNS